MKSPVFEYERVGTAEDALRALRTLPDPKLLAGGQSLMPLLHMRLARPAWLIDINGIAGLDHVRRGADGTLRIGALCRHSQLEHDSLIARSAPLLGIAAAHIAHPQIRNRGTLGGSISHSDPAAELPAALIALEACVSVMGEHGSRQIPANEFFTGFFTTSLAPDEMVTEVVVPVPDHFVSSAFIEFAPRHGDFAVAGICVALSFSDGRCSTARGAGCGLAAAPVDLNNALEALEGETEPHDALLRVTAARVGEAFEPISDIRCPAGDRRELAQTLVVEAVRTAWRREAMEAA